MQEEKGNPELYCLEYFDWRVQYGRTLKNDVLNESLDHEWKQSDQEYPKLNEWNKVSAPTLKVTQDGCLWAAYPKHGTQEFETPRITWGEIEAVARGENPFATLGEKGKENEPEPNQETPDDPA
jgi:hypothetical protein